MKEAKVIHPSASFDAGAILVAFRNEGVTNILAVLVMITALLENQNFKNTDTSTLFHVNLVARTLLPEDIRTCTDDLKADEVKEFYGMTETGTGIMGPLTSHAKLHTHNRH